MAADTVNKNQGYSSQMQVPFPTHSSPLKTKQLNSFIPFSPNITMISESVNSPPSIFSLKSSKRQETRKYSLGMTTKIEGKYFTLGVWKNLSWQVSAMPFWWGPTRPKQLSVVAWYLPGWYGWPHAYSLDKPRGWCHVCPLCLGATWCRQSRSGSGVYII